MLLLSGTAACPSHAQTHVTRPSFPSCCRLLQALAATHVAALRACQAHLDVVQQRQLLAASTLCGLAVAIGQSPLAVGLDLALHELLRQLWRRSELLVSRVEGRPAESGP